MVGRINLHLERCIGCVGLSHSGVFRKLNIGRAQSTAVDRSKKLLSGINLDEAAIAEERFNTFERGNVDGRCVESHE